MNAIIENLRTTLSYNSDKAVKESQQRFFKEEVKTYGIKSAVTEKIGKEAFVAIQSEPKEAVFALCEELFKSGYLEESGIACQWAYNLRKQFVPDDFKTFERWIEKYVTNWATCDMLCNHTIGAFIEKYPVFVKELKRWAHSENRWMKRAAAVTFIIPARKGLFLSDILEIAGILLSSGDDMVQKGYGWALKAASMSETFVKGSAETKKEHLDAVFNFVQKNKAIMPRTALRYAIEKMPADLKAKAMAKDR